MEGDRNTFQAVEMLKKPKIVIRRCPMPIERKNQVLSFLRKMFSVEDFSLADTLEGRYEDTSENYFFLAEVEDKVVGTAWYIASPHCRRVGAFGEVATNINFRGKKIATLVCQEALNHFLSNGGEYLYLATANPQAGRIYEKLGFINYNGNVMRYRKEGNEEIKFLEPFKIRNAVWGDFALVTALYTKPYDEIVIRDYARNLITSPGDIQKRCCSIFPLIFYDIQKRGGLFNVLEDNNGFVLGTAIITPYREKMILDFFMDSTIKPKSIKEFLTETIKEFNDRDGSTKLFCTYIAPGEFKKSFLMSGFGFKKKFAKKIERKNGKKEIIHVWLFSKMIQ